MIYGEGKALLLLLRLEFTALESSPVTSGLVTSGLVTSPSPSACVDCIPSGQGWSNEGGETSLSGRSDETLWNLAAGGCSRCGNWPPDLSPDFPDLPPGYPESPELKGMSGWGRREQAGRGLKSQHHFGDLFCKHCRRSNEQGSRIPSAPKNKNPSQGGNARSSKQLLHQPPALHPPLPRKPRQLAAR